MYADLKNGLISQAKGRVLEIGAGTGESVKYYKKDQIEIIYGIEPNIEALGNLRKQLVKADIVDKYEILPFGVEEAKKLQDAGISKGSIDTILCVSSFCNFRSNSRCYVYVPCQRQRKLFLYYILY